MDIYNPWLVAIGSGIIVGIILAIYKRDWRDKKVPQAWGDEYARKKGFSGRDYGWANVNEYEAQGYLPIYYKPWGIWFRQRICYKEMILVYKKRP